MRSDELNYLKAIVIVHGKSEKQLCEFIKSNLKLNCYIESDKKGEKSIQITSVMNILRNTKYKDFTSFISNFAAVKLVDVESVDQKKGKKNKKVKQVLSEEFKIFIIMDTDDCTDMQREEFINKEMFKNHWAYDHIVPIFNDSNLEDVMVACNINFEKRGADRKKEYIKIFPTDKKYIKKDSVQIEEFSNKLAKCKKTNMNIFTEFCLSNK